MNAPSRLRWVRAAFLVLIAGTAMADAPPPATVLSLAQCVRTAIEQATLVLKAKNEADVSGTQLVQAYMQFLPNLHAAANYGVNSGREYFTQAQPTFVTTTNHGGIYQLSSELNLFNGFSDFAGWHSSARRKEAANLSLYRAKQQITFDVTQIYLQVLLDRQIVSIDESNLAASHEREQLLEAQAQSGLRSLADLYRQEAQTSADELSLIVSRAKAKDDLLALLQRIRVDLLTHYEIADVVLDTAPAVNPYNDETRLIQDALRQRADLEAQEQVARAARWDVASARAGYYPQLNLVGSLEGTGTWLTRQTVDGADVVPPSQPSLMHQWGTEVLYTAGVNLSWGLFDRYLTRLTVARAEETASNSAIDAQDRRLQVESDMQQALNDYFSAFQQISTAQKGLKAAQESYAAVQERYKVGASNIVDLLTAQSALVQAQASQAQANIGFTLQNRAIELALGTLSPH